MNSPWASLNLLLPPTRTSRQRIAVAGGALLLLAALAWALWALLAPPKVDNSKQWFSVEFTTDNQAHPVHLTLPDGKEGIFDLLMIWSAGRPGTRGLEEKARSERGSSERFSIMRRSNMPSFPSGRDRCTGCAWLSVVNSTENHCLR